MSDRVIEEEEVKFEFSRFLTQSPLPPMRLALGPPQHLVHLIIRDMNK